MIVFFYFLSFYNQNSLDYCFKRETFFSLAIQHKISHKCDDDYNDLIRYYHIKIIIINSEWWLLEISQFKKMLSQSKF